MQVKLYDYAGTLIQAVSPKDIIGNLSWTAQINWGQGELRVKLNIPVSTPIDADIIRVVGTDEYRPIGEVIYTWVITKIAREIAETEYIEITALGLSTLFGWKSYTWVGNENKQLSTWMSDAVDLMNASYNLFTKVIDPLTTMGTFSFATLPLWDVIESIKAAGWSYTIDGKGRFIWKNRENQTNHTLTLGKNVERISVVDNTEMIRNRVYVLWAYGTVTVQDTPSITEFWPRELFEVKTDIEDATYAGIYWTSKLVTTTSRTLSVSVHDYDIYSILPGHTITVRNTPLSINSLQVHKISYGNKKATIEVENIESIGNALRK